MKNIAVVLAGCGNRDGTEITEAVSALISISETGASYQCFAPNLEVNEVDHLTAKPTGLKRNTLHEGARIARGKIKDLKELNARDFEGIVFPGGFAAANILSNWGEAGSNAKVNSDVERVIKEFHKQSKPICAICIAPTLLARVLGSTHAALTIGNDLETSQEISKTGADHVECEVNDYVTDRENKLITTPAYMYGKAKPHEVFIGIRGAIKEFMEMA